MVCVVTTPFVNVEQKAVADEWRSWRRQLSALHFRSFVDLDVIGVVAGEVDCLVPDEVVRSERVEFILVAVGK